jgi:hypothetical protein
MKRKKLIRLFKKVSSYSWKTSITNKSKRYWQNVEHVIKKLTNTNDRREKNRQRHKKTHTKTKKRVRQMWTLRHRISQTKKTNGQRVDKQKDRKTNRQIA